MKNVSVHLTSHFVLTHILNGILKNVTNYKFGVISNMFAHNFGPHYGTKTSNQKLISVFCFYFNELCCCVLKFVDHDKLHVGLLIVLDRSDTSSMLTALF